jgi:GNAT superfamily N-acetyltransferase
MNELGAISTDPWVEPMDFRTDPDAEPYGEIILHEIFGSIATTGKSARDSVYTSYLAAYDKTHPRDYDIPRVDHYVLRSGEDGRAATFATVQQNVGNTALKLKFLGTLPDRRRQGYGGLMLQFVETEALRRGLSIVRLTVRPYTEASTFYNNRRYEPFHDIATLQKHVA